MIHNRTRFTLKEIEDTEIIDTFVGKLTNVVIKMFKHPTHETRALVQIENGPHVLITDESLDWVPEGVRNDSNA